VPTHRSQRRTLETPGAVARIADGRKGADALEKVWIFQANGESAMAPHGVAKNGHSRKIQALAIRLEQHDQLFCDIGVHPVVLPFCHSCIEIKSCSCNTETFRRH
jgi:hypothetical protein